MIKKTLIFFPFMFCIKSFANNGDCIHHAALCFNVNPLLIKAIILKESDNRQEAINFNGNNTYDVGIMQINSTNFNSLKRIGIDENALRNSSCINVFAGTWILGNIIKQYGYTWEDIGRYHSKTPSLRDSYSHSIIRLILHKSDKIDTIIIPYVAGTREKFSC